MTASTQTAPQRMTMTIEEAAEALGIGRQSAYQAARTGELPTIRLGRRLIVPRGRLLALLGEPPESSPNANEPTANGLAGKKPEDARHAPF